MFNLGGGQFLYGDGSPIAGGVLTLSLSGAATIINGGGAAPSSYTFSLDSNGVIIGSAPVYGNAELSPAGTYYIATVTAASIIVWGPINWSVGPAALYSGSLYPNVLVLPTWSGGGGGGNVSSVFGRTGAVLAVSGDYNDIKIAPVFVTVTFSATPTFNASLSKKFKITLTNNVTGSTLSNATAGDVLIFQIIEGGSGGYNFVWPSNVKGGMTLNKTLGAVNVQAFIYDGTNAYALAPGTTT